MGKPYRLIVTDNNTGATSYHEGETKGEIDSLALTIPLLISDNVSMTKQFYNPHMKEWFRYHANSKKG